MAGQRFVVNKKRFVLGGSLGDGAAGLVRRATAEDTREEYAVKFLAPDPKYIEESAFGDVAARFKRERERGSHLFEIINARQSRGTTASRYFDMGYKLQDRDDWVAELVIDMI